MNDTYFEHPAGSITVGKWAHVTLDVLLSTSPASVQVSVDNAPTSANLTKAAQPDPVCLAFTSFHSEIILEQAQQGSYFTGRALPIVRGESIEGEGSYAERQGRADDTAHGGYARAMAFRPWKPSRSGPAAIAVQQNGNVNFRIGNKLGGAVAHGLELIILSTLPGWRE